MIVRRACVPGGFGPPDATPDSGAILTRAALVRLFRPLHDDYAATIVLTAALPNTDRRAAITARHDAYIEALAEVLTTAIETTAALGRGGTGVRR